MRTKKSPLTESRRKFLKNTIATSTVLAAGGVLPHFTPKSYARILNSNERIQACIMGVNSRGKALAQNFAQQENCDVIHIADVDERAIASCLEAIKDRQSVSAIGMKDFRQSLESPDIDALVVAAPDHWHAPASLLAMQAGKHVYVEKPCSHNPREGEILVEAAKHYGLQIQMGNQRRSWPNVVEAIQSIHEGAIGKVYYGRGWYSNNRPSMGTGTVTMHPEWLDWELWQGPAPRRPFKDNIVHYNWHWLWHWGTGEALNNGTHMIDLLRWGMQVDFPSKVSSIGGRFRYDDDWETPDTQTISLSFDEGKAMTWEGLSCNGKGEECSSVGVKFFGEQGSIFIPGGNSYSVFDLKGERIHHVEDSVDVDTRNATNPAEQLDAYHIQNFFDGITKGKSLHSDIDSGHKSTLLVQLGNIAQRMGRSLNTDPANGHILDDLQAQKLWSRDYEPGWEMKI